MTSERQRRVAACLGAALGLVVYVSSDAGRLTVERQGDRLRLSAPELHFVAGAPLEQLRAGASVTYAISVTVTAERGGAERFRLDDIFTVSYDLWEERFSVARTRPPARSASHLVAEAVEAWCLDALQVPVSAVPAAGTFVIQLDCLVPSAENDREDAPSRLTLTGLLDALSRRARAASPQWRVRSVPLRLADLKAPAP